ncbi:hypothetical protein WJX82_003912 [Trebouxia sp. C0006]
MKVTKAAQLWVFWQGVMYRRQHGIGTSCCSQESAHCWKQSSNMAQIAAELHPFLKGTLMPSSHGLP